MSSVILSEMLTTIRAAADKAKATVMAEVKTQNASLPTGSKLPSLAIANHTKAAKTAEASAALIEALQSGKLVVKGAGKVLKSGDASIRIGAPLRDLKTVIADAQASALKSREARMVKRFREKFPTDTTGKTDAQVLHAAKVYAAAQEQEKAEKAAAAQAKTKETGNRTTPETTPAVDGLAGVLRSLELAAA